MTQFVLATLEQNEPGAVYEGSVFDRWLTIAHSSGKKLPIFDPSFPVNISSSLKVGQPYEFLVSPVVFRDLKIQDDIGEVQRGELEWQGIVRTLDWQFKKEDFPLAVTYLYDEHWALVETQLGTVAFKSRKLQALDVRAEIGATLCWKELRTDLLAVR
jgi:hypothetical protein